MKLVVFFCLCVGVAHALPNSILGVLGVSNSPLDDEDLTEEFLAGAGWSDDGGLPGRWQGAPRSRTKKK